MKRVSRGRAKSYRLMGGPWPDEEAILRGDTMIFSVGEWRGRYVVELSGLAQWEDVRV